MPILKHGSIFSRPVILPWPIHWRIICGWKIITLPFIVEITIQIFITDSAFIYTERKWRNIDCLRVSPALKNPAMWFPGQMLYYVSAKSGGKLVLRDNTIRVVLHYLMAGFWPVYFQGPAKANIKWLCHVSWMRGKTKHCNPCLYCCFVVSGS